MSISDICDMVNDNNPEIDQANNKLKAFWEEKLGNNIQSAYQSVKLNLSLFIPHLLV